MFINNIKYGLQSLVTDDAVRDKVSRDIEADMAFLNWKPPPNSDFFDFHKNVDEVVQHFSKDGITRAKYVKTALKAPSLFYQNSATIIANVEGVTDHFADDGLTREDYLKAALKWPGLLRGNPA